MTDKQRQTLQMLDVEITNPYMTNYQAGQLIQKAYEERKRQASSLADEAREASLYDLADKYVTWRHDSHAHAKGPCPMKNCNSTKDAFYVSKLLNTGGCRQCGWQNKGEGAGPIGFICAKEDVTWIEAARLITNRKEYVRIEKTKTRKKDELPSGGWRGLWEPRLAVVQRKFPHTRAMKYLTGRGIALETAQYFGVGGGIMSDGPHQGKPVAIFPYYRDGVLCAVNRRVAGKVEDDKCRFVTGSRKVGYFGVWGETGRVWVIEGETNALSVWQVLWHQLGALDTVLSLSGEGDMVGRRHEVKARWPEALVWVDKAKIAEKIAQCGLNAFSTTDDANDHLLAGTLRGKIDEILKGRHA